MLSYGCRTVGFVGFRPPSLGLWCGLDCLLLEALARSLKRGLFFPMMVLCVDRVDRVSRVSEEDNDSARIRIRYQEEEQGQNQGLEVCGHQLAVTVERVVRQGKVMQTRKKDKVEGLDKKNAFVCMHAVTTYNYFEFSDNHLYAALKSSCS